MSLNLSHASPPVRKTCVSNVKCYVDAIESAQPVLGFLTDGQDRFFFDLHRFNSELGRQSFASAKEENAARLKSLSLGLRARIAMRGRPQSGRQVLNAYSETVAGLV